MPIDRKLKVLLGVWVIDIVVAVLFGWSFETAIAYVLLTSILVSIWTEWVYTKKVKVTRWVR